MTDTPQHQTGAAASRYDQLTPDREHFLQRADKAAKLTLPMLFARGENPSSSKDIKDPVQSLGSRGVNTLSAKMTLSVLPLNTPFFKLNVNTLKLKQDGAGDKETEIKKGFAVIERGVLRKVENTGDITTTFEALKHLCVTGNVLYYVGKDNSRLYDLNKYVVMRDPQGVVKEIVVCEDMSPSSMSDEARKIITAARQANAESPDKTVKVYTHVFQTKDRIKWHQEVEGHVVPGSSSSVPPDANPWMALRFLRVDGENYGRGYVEMYMGDLESLEVLSKAVRDAAVQAAKVVWLVKPHGTTSSRVIAQAANGDVKSGDANDITVLRLDKAADLRVAENMIKSLESRLAFAFMLNSEVMRDAERVTAEEVRFVAQELDDSLGGIYSILSRDFQLPYVKRRMHLMRAEGEIPKLPETVDPVIVTGFAALGRGHDREKLMRYAGTIAELVGKEELPKYVNIIELVNRLAVADGIETEGLLVTKEETEAAQQKAEQQGMLEKFGPEVLKQVGGAAQAQLSAPTADPQQTQPPVPQGTP